MSPEFYWVAVIAITAVSSARLARLFTIDKFPPIKKRRDAYEEKVEGTGWEYLTICAYCFGFWTTLALMVWGYLAGVYQTPIDHSLSAQVWWAFNLLFAVTYFAGMTVARDGAVSEDD